jgi:predicted PurR-regulated permease PerM
MPTKSKKAADKTKKIENTEKIVEKKINLMINPLSETKQSLVRSLQLIISALTLVAGLAWNDAIKNFISSAVEPAIRAIFSDTLGDLASLVTPFIYAIIITFLVVFVINRVQKLEEVFAYKTETETKS